MNRTDRPAPRSERREQARKHGRRGPRTTAGPRRWLLLGAALLALAAIGYSAWSNRSTRVAQQRAWAEELKQVQSFPEEPRDHVPVGAPVQYKTDPPTSGPHYDSTASPVFYDRDVDPRLLVHNLEHGHIVIYYDRQALPPDVVERVQELTRRYRGEWEAVLAVPRSDQEHPLILTAWTRMLRLKEYRPAAVDAFIDAYRGRGPENRVR